MNSRKNAAADILAGSRWRGAYGTARVMATAEGYVMARQAGCCAWVMHHKDFRREYEPMEDAVPAQCNVTEPKA